MPPVLALLQLMVISMHVLGLSVATDTVAPGQPLVGGSDRLVSSNGKFALGFFQAAAGSQQSSSTTTPSPWYLGMWFNHVPNIAPVWVANRDDPVTDPNAWQLAISSDGNLVVAGPTANSTIWSTRANSTTNDTIAVLLGNGNLVLQEASNSSNVLWQSFDHPTDTLLSGAKFGRNKVTGLNRRLVSKKNQVSQATGAYRAEFDPHGSNQLVIAPLNASAAPYWNSGPWNGKYFNSLPEMQSGFKTNFTYVNNDQEEYFTFTLEDDTMLLRHLLDVSGQAKSMVWVDGSHDWLVLYSQPSAQCD